MKFLSLISIVLFFFFNGKKTTNSIVKNITETVLKKDTIKLSLDKDLIENDLVYINLEKITYNKDSVQTANFKFNFYRNNKFEKTFSAKTEGYEPNSEWYLNTDLAVNADNKNNFFVLSNGYPACGYVQTGFLFYNENYTINLIDSFFSIRDSGWYTVTDFVLFKNKVLSSRIESFSPSDDENATEDDGILTHSDSITYTLKSNKWIKKRITKKDEVYKSEKKTFNEVHKIE